ncbi:MAG: EpsI family protein [Candidatus Brocadiaceae bacterium]
MLILTSLIRSNYGSLFIKNYRVLIVNIILLSALIYSFGFSKPKYESANILSQLQIPYDIGEWRGEDTDQSWSVDDERFNFISGMLQRKYNKANDQSVFLTILDAGNFHNPKVCSNSSGYKVKELNDLNLILLNRNLKAHAIYADKENEGYLIIYWICINKDIVNWTEQKIKQLWFSLTNKKNAGLMIRFDVPCDENSIPDSLKLCEEFILNLSRTLSLDEAEYIIGKRIQ